MNSSEAVNRVRLSADRAVRATRHSRFAAVSLFVGGAIATHESNSPGKAGIAAMGTMAVFESVKLFRHRRARQTARITTSQFAAEQLKETGSLFFDNGTPPETGMAEGGLDQDEPGLLNTSFIIRFGGIAGGLNAGDVTASPWWSVGYGVLGAVILGVSFVAETGLNTTTGTIAATAAQRIQGMAAAAQGM